MDLFPFEKLLVRKFIFQPIFAIRVRGAQVKPKEKVQTLAGLRGPELGPRKIGMSRGQYGNQILGVGGRRPFLGASGPYLLGIETFSQLGSHLLQLQHLA